MNWTKEDIEYLKTAHAAKISFSRIAQKLGKSKNAVIGKCYRLGLKMKAGKSIPVARYQEIDQTCYGPAKTIFELKSDDCRWPIGNIPNLKYCGAPTTNGKSYCSNHCLKGYQTK